MYSITTNQAAIAALFRVVNRYVGNLGADAGRLPGLSGTSLNLRASGDEERGAAALPFPTKNLPIVFAWAMGPGRPARASYGRP
ncbi:hypothetical protein ACVW1B_001750 [Bradyrhizobium sp. USDA 4502]